MNREELSLHAGHRTGNICIDLRFDTDTATPRATIIYFNRGQCSVGMKYLLYEAGKHLDDSQFAQAFLVGEYPSLEAIIEHLELFLGVQFVAWTNYTRLGQIIELTATELSAYKAIDWQHWLPERLMVPSGTTFHIMQPEEWAGRTLLEPIVA
ncbi:hypothetical protein Q0M94_01530 [Deinococcus radiomollis]|uniref:hypothetical protein n=1 Tax=Deinococcus radiomollis TaxID=468916 RepID=UPI00389231DA